MPTIAYKDVNDFIRRTRVVDWPSVTLIFGEEMLCKQVATAVLDALMPPAERLLGLETVDGGQDAIDRVLASMNTYALLSGSKVVVVHDSHLFYTSRAGRDLRDKMATSAQRGELKKASRPFLNLMALMGLQLDDLASASLRGKLVDDVDGQPPAWFSQLTDFCRENQLTVPVPRDDAERLTSAMAKGFLPGHRLLITTDVVDRRKTLFKTVAETGLIVDCSVPRGESRADRSAQEAVMQAVVEEMLAQAGKRMAANARRRLSEWTGFDLRTLAANLEKLISFTGERRTIGDADVAAVLQRTRKDPIFEFTNAMADRDLAAALFFMQSLLDDGMHPLQLLAAAANQVRRLLLAKDFIVRDRGRSWTPGMNFARFKAACFQTVRDDDAGLHALVADWEAIINPLPDGGKAKKSAGSDLVLAKNPNSPFPVFHLLQRAERFSLEALRSAMVALSATDRRMKSTGQDPCLLLEAFLIDFCRPANGPAAKV